MEDLVMSCFVSTMISGKFEIGTQTSVTIACRTKYELLSISSLLERLFYSAAWTHGKASVEGVVSSRPQLLPVCRIGCKFKT